MWLLLIGVSAVVLLAGLVHVAVRRHAQRILATPDTCSSAVLGREPDGEEVFVDRPDGTRLRARVHHAAGPTLVFVHGFTGTLLAWNLVWQRLQDSGCRLIAYDLRGHGRSTTGTTGLGSAQMADDLRAVLDHFDVRDGLVVGHSMGGFVALVCMLTHADVVRARLRHAVLLASFAGDVLRGAPQNRVQVPLFESGLLQRLVRSRDYGWALTASFFGPRPTPAGVEVYRQVLAGQALRSLTPILRAMMAETYYPRLSEIDVPCTVLAGADDRTAPAWHAEALRRGLRGARFERLERVGHMLLWEAPDAVAERLRSIATAPDVAAFPPT